MPRRGKKEKKQPIKGEEIRFIRGTYKRCTGWIDTANKSKKKKDKLIYVIVNDEDYSEIVHAHVWRSSIREMHKEPVTWAEAAVQEYPEVEDAMIEMARLFSTCLIPDDASVSVMNLIGIEIRRAQAENLQLPQQTVRVVTFP
jgi:hypothetical protein